MIVISDASPLITLAEVGYLETLPGLYKSIIITLEVYNEVAIAGDGLAGELSTIALAREMNADLTIMDDRQARRLAGKQGLDVFDCVGVLETAFRSGLITDLTAAYRRLIASEAYINREILKASLAMLKQPALA